MDRIRFFIFNEAVSQEEIYLWRILLGCFREPLLPNLRGLAIVFSTGSDFPSEIFGVVPNALKSLHTDVRSLGYGLDYGLRQAMMFYNMFMVRGGTAEAISHRGPSCPHLLSVMASFTDLTSLRFIHSKHSCNSEMHDFYVSCTISLPQVVERLPSLISLQIDLGVFEHASTSFYVGDSIALEHIHLTGNPKELQAFISRNKCSTLQSLSLGIYPTSTYATNLWRFLCGKAAANFPSLRSFTVESGGEKEVACPPIVINDLMLLFSLSLSTFALKRIPHILYPYDVAELSKGWPNLRNLTLVSCGNRPDPAILVPLSEFHCLRSLTVRLDFRALSEGPGSCRSMPRWQSLLEDLTIVDPGSSLPSTMEGMFELACALLRLFPNILTISSNPEFGSDQTHGMQKFVTIYKSMVQTLSQRGYPPVDALPPVAASPPLIHHISTTPATSANVVMPSLTIAAPLVTHTSRSAPQKFTEKIKEIFQNLMGYGRERSQ